MVNVFHRAAIGYYLLLLLILQRLDIDAEGWKLIGRGLQVYFSWHLQQLQQIVEKAQKNKKTIVMVTRKYNHEKDGFLFEPFEMKQNLSS